MRLITGAVVELSAEERALMREVRHATRMPAKLFAYMSGCSLSSLYSWEMGERRPSLEAYQRWYWFVEDLTRATGTLLSNPSITGGCDAD